MKERNRIKRKKRKKLYLHGSGKTLNIHSIYKNIKYKSIYRYIDINKDIKKK